MSFNGLNYDNEQYKQLLNQSVGPGVYQINQPPISCTQCYPNPPTVRLQRQGDSVDKTQPLIDVDSDLMGITRIASKDPSKQYLPKDRPSDDNLLHLKDCFIPRESCRLSNPPCTLRGTGWNRWEWLCKNPQDRINFEFNCNVSNRTLFKDNHRPCIPTPVDQKNAWPKGGKLFCDKINPVCGVPTQPPSVQWPKLNNIKQS